MPEFMQGILVREVYGLPGGDVALYIAVACALIATMFSALPLVWCCTCVEAWGNSKKLNGESYDVISK